MAGGGRDSTSFHVVISDSKYSKTMLGEADGKVTARLQKIAGAMEEADMKPFLSEQITSWLIPHYVFIAGLSAGAIKSGGTIRAFANNSRIIKDSIKAIREGFSICLARGIDPRKEKVNKLYYMPLFISTPVVKHILSHEAMSTMFDGYLKSGREEVEAMLESIVEYGKKYNIEMSYLKSLQKSLIEPVG